MLPPNLSDLTLADLERLVENQVVERKTLDYKRDLPDKTADARKEFFADVSAFANAGGGHLLLGVEDADGIPIALPGVPGASEDELKQRIENLRKRPVWATLPG